MELYQLTSQSPSKRIYYGLQAIEEAPNHGDQYVGVLPVIGGATYFAGCAVLKALGWPDRIITGVHSTIHYSIKQGMAYSSLETYENSLNYARLGLTLSMFTIMEIDRKALGNRFERIIPDYQSDLEGFK